MPARPRVLLFYVGDGGDHWTTVSRNLTAGQTGLYASMAVDASDPDTLYVAANPLQISRDGGATFRSRTTPFELGKTAAGPLWTDRARPGLLSSTPTPSTGGCSSAASSKEVPMRTKTFRTACVLLVLSVAAFAQTPRSRWARFGPNGSGHERVLTLVFQPQSPDTIYVGLGNLGADAFRSTDGGKAWEPFARRVTRDGLLDLAIDPLDPSLLVAANLKGAWRSRDGGATWRRIDPSRTYRVAVTGLFVGRFE